MRAATPNSQRLGKRKATAMPFAERITATINETCAATGLSRSTLYPLLNRGEIEYVVVNHRRLPLVASVLDYIASRPRDASASGSRWGAGLRAARAKKDASHENTSPQR
jgi:hypothetical protein